MQKHIKLMSVPWWQTVRNGHIITFVFKLLIATEDKKILYTQVNHKFVQEETEMQESRLQKGGKHEGDCKKPEETSKAG